MAKKFDTNRLDPDFPQKARETAAASEVRPRFETAEFPLPPGSVTEDETRRFSADELNRTAMPAQQGPLYRPPTAPAAMPGDRPVASTGIPEKWLLGLSYFPFTIGLVAGIILLLVIPKEETRVRFHAAQGLAAHFGILIVTAILRAIDKVTDLVKCLQDSIATLEKAIAHDGADSLLAEATHFRDEVLPAMAAVRQYADALEGMVADDLWALPTYQEMLFIK